MMHETSFSPLPLQNILVEAKSPEWLIKIADFGISKRAQEGGTELRTMEVGTLGYMAPEVFGFSPGNDSTVAYSATIDIWAIGVIAFEMLLKKQPFVSVKDLFDYVRGAKQLSLAGMYELGVSASCQEFLKAVLSPNPVTRPTAGSAGNHAWLATLATPMDTEDSYVAAQILVAEPNH
jgi:serine/threonine protein kinase